MRRKWVLLVPAGLSLALGAAVVLWMLVRPAAPPQFTKEMADRVRKDMTEDEVAAVLGKPAGNDAGGNVVWVESGPRGFWQGPEGLSLENGQTEKGWISWVGAVGVVFGPDGRVIHSWWEPVLDLDEPMESPLGRLPRLIRDFFP
jgi:hypothetical protein